MATYDVVIIGGGIVGLATGMAWLQRAPKASVLVLEKESRLAPHQTGHNSGVIHSGIYYPPGSFKATFAREGNRRMVEFCRQHGIPHRVCGKIIVASRPEELPQLEHLHRRGIANGLDLSPLTREQIAEMEPHCAALAGLKVTSTGIVDYGDVALAMADVIQKQGGEIRTGLKVEAIGQTSRELTVECGTESVSTRFLVNCAGLHSDRIARLMGVQTGMEIVPIRGEYFMLRPEKRALVNGPIYPVPNPRYPFLGVHFTKMISGDVHAGPNAVLCLKREGYSKTAFDVRDTAALFRSPAFWRFAARNWPEGGRELLRSASKRLFVKSLQRMIPAVEMDDLVAPHAGVRAQALGKDGRLIDDFVLMPGPRSIHVCNAPSPAATASLCIGEAVTERAMQFVSIT